LGIQTAFVDGRWFVTSVDVSLEGRVTPGDVIRAVGNSEKTLDLGAHNAVDIPDQLPSFAQNNRFFADQKTLHQLISKGEVYLHLDAGDSVPLKPRACGLTDVPRAFG